MKWIKVISILERNIRRYHLSHQNGLHEEVRLSPWEYAFAFLLIKARLFHVKLLYCAVIYAHNLGIYHYKHVSQFFAIPLNSQITTPWKAEKVPFIDL